MGFAGPISVGVTAGARLPSHHGRGSDGEAVYQRAMVPLLEAQIKHTHLPGKPWLMARRMTLWPMAKQIIKSMFTAYPLTTKTSGCSFPAGNSSINNNTRLIFISQCHHRLSESFPLRMRDGLETTAFAMVSSCTDGGKPSWAVPTRFQSVQLQLLIYSSLFFVK